MLQRQQASAIIDARKMIVDGAVAVSYTHLDVYKRQVLVCVYGINGAKCFVQGFWQLLVILSVMNLKDRLLVDGYWAVSYTHLTPFSSAIRSQVFMASPELSV